MDGSKNRQRLEKVARWFHPKSRSKRTEQSARINPSPIPQGPPNPNPGVRSNVRSKDYADTGPEDGTRIETQPKRPPNDETLPNGVQSNVAHKTRGANALLEPDSHHAPLSNGSSWRETGSSAIEALGISITQVLESHEIGIDVLRPHFPDSQYPVIFTSETIKQTLPEASSDLLIFIRDKAIKLFAITVLSNQTALFPAMKAFHSHNVTDKDCLPITRKLTAHGECDNLDDNTECSSKCQAERGGRCKHDARLDVFHHKYWNRTKLKSFYDQQWPFFLQRFLHQTFKYDLHSDCILPFKRTGAKDGKTGPGHFSDVTHALMLADFQDKIDSKAQDNVNVAIKTLRPLDEKGYNIVSEWNSESDAHKELDQLGSEHITRGLAAYSQHGKYHIILEWADGGSLRSFWKDKPNPPLSKQTSMELLRQLHGLAQALFSMHNTAVSLSRGDSRKSRNSSLGSSPGSHAGHSQDAETPQQKFPEIIAQNTESLSSNSQPDKKPSPPIIMMEGVVQNGDHSDAAPIHPLIHRSSGIGENWRHGDIKPDNILRFSNGTWLGTLKLADLGRAKQRYLATRELPDKEIDRWRTKPYEAPDIWISQGRASMSRLYDCWAMGCVFFEAIIWMLYGIQANWNFEETTAKAQKEGTPYWSRVGESDAEVSAVVRSWMNHILEHDPECNTKTGTVMGDLMKLVKGKLLKVHLPPNSNEYTKGFRTNAEDMLKDLETILLRAEAEERGETDDKYIFTGSNRAEVQLPSIDPDSDTTQELKNVSNFLTLPNPRNRHGNSLALPPQRVNGALTTRRQNQYTHSLNDVWRYVDDDQFAVSILQHNKFPFSNLFTEIAPSVCTACQEIGDNYAHLTFNRSVRDLRKALSTKSCMICPLLYSAATNSDIESTATVKFTSSPAGLRINDENHLSLRFCRPWDLPGIKDSAAYPPIGLPELPSAGSKQHITILRAWLIDCDANHECVRIQTNQFVPKRLLAVGSDQEPPRLVETKSLTEKERENIRYMALSHPWGNSTHHKHFRTTSGTMADYLDFIELSMLPQTFRDAVVITRELKIGYIWIDSICIHQGADGDFKEQAPHMQDIFGSAYCVLAASSADGMTSGFMKSPQTKAVAIPAKFGSNQDKLFLCQTVDNFQQDVLESHLNRRGWVFQERVLARRTIFFATNQTYFECANGVRCETFSKLENSEEAFLGDSDFPTYVVQEKNKGAQQYLFESLFKKYSRLAFSEPTDKPIAISGLEQRLLRVFADRGGAGIFEKHWGRCLLWKRASNNKALTRIDFQLTAATKAKASYEFRPPPSWSWMSYLGSIDYVEPPHDGVYWNTKTVELCYTGGPASSWLSAAASMIITAEARDFDIGFDTNTDETRLTYDDDIWKDRVKKCVIIGSMKTTTVRYVLIVSPKESSKMGGYERIGVGYLPGKFIKRLHEKVDVITVE